MSARMIIPIACFNCGNQLATLWRYYQARLKEEKGDTSPEPFYLDGRQVPVTAEKKVLDELGLRRDCCRNHLLTHVDLIDKI
jgi:DNA-directed RNA polymerase subunit N (RpoN/RPB10)